MKSENYCGSNMQINKILIANRGEIAIRISRAASELGIQTVSIYSDEDSESLHTRVTDESFSLNNSGVPAYLNIEKIIELAQQSNCDAIHPGYGFLAENSEFAQKCVDANLIFIGPSVEMLKLFGSRNYQATKLANAKISFDKPKAKRISINQILNEQSADNIHPFNIVGLLLTELRGTATLIYPTHIITAAHCV